jgi:hypothetical protein
MSDNEEERKRNRETILGGGDHKSSDFTIETIIKFLKTPVGKSNHKSSDLTLETLMTFLRTPLGIGLIVFVVGYTIYSLNNPYSSYHECVVHKVSKSKITQKSFTYHVSKICRAEFPN